MSDLIFVGASLVFFLVAIVYSHGCDSLKGGGGNA